MLETKFSFLDMHIHRSWLRKIVTGMVWIFIAVRLAAAVGTTDTSSLVLEQLERSREQYRTVETWQQRRVQLRDNFLKGAGLWPLPEKSPLNPIVHSRREYDGYSVENIALESMPGFYCTGNLYRPLKTKRPGPAILCPHGHFTPLGRFRAEQQIRCAHLARMGATVLSYSMVGWQDSQQTSHKDPLVLALQTWNSIRALDYLAGLPEVDASRIGMTGASGGGTQTFFLAFLDDRIAASAPVGIVYPWAPPLGCLCESGLPVMQAAGTNAIELAASIAPRPQLFISIGHDNTRDFPKVGFPFVRDVYDILKRADAARNVHLPDEYHDFGLSKRRAVYEFFAQHLQLPLLPEAADSIVIESPEQMEVFNGSHPLPANALQGSAAVDQALISLPRSVPRASAASNPLN